MTAFLLGSQWRGRGPKTVRFFSRAFWDSRSYKAGSDMQPNELPNESGPETGTQNCPLFLLDASEAERNEI